jgi:Zn-dependent protease
MNHTIPLGSIRGIRIGAHWSLAAMWAVVVLSLGPPMADFAGSTVVGYLVALGLAAAFAASVLVHEIAHAVVAQRAGVEVPRITLWVLGGIAEVATRMPTAGSTVAVAVAGPASSLALALAGLAGAVGAAAAGLPEAVTAPLVLLAWINATLAVFNMLPGSPLDGGRVLSGIAWRLTGSRSRGELVAANAGTVLSAALGAAGAAQLAAGGYGGVWLLLVAWFVFSSSRTEAANARLERASEAATVAQVTEELGDRVVNGQVTAHGLRAMGINRPVKVHAGPGELRVLDAAALSRARPDATAAELSVTNEGRTVEATAPLLDALALMQHVRSGPVLVTDDTGVVVGVVSPARVRALLATGPTTAPTPAAPPAPTPAT